MIPHCFPTDIDVRAVLDHARGQFQYHAKQRLDSIRYFTAFYGLIIAGCLSLLAKEHEGALFREHVSFFTGFTLAVISLIFWGLDFRNAQMVNIDEKALSSLENSIQLKYGLADFNITENCEKPLQHIRKYSFLANLLFIFLFLLSAVITINPFG